MDIFKGISTQGRNLLAYGKLYRTETAGTLVFGEGDPAIGLFTVVTGEVEISRGKGSNKVLVTKLGPGEVFGEIGLVKENRTRTASAVVSQEATLFELPGNPVESLQKLVGPADASAMLQNLICLMAKRLHRLDSNPPVILPEYKDHPDYVFQPEKWIAVIEKSLPTGIFKRFLTQSTYAPGKVLCHEGAAPDGFYFIHRGAFAVEKREGMEKTIILHGPTIAGEVGFFAKQPRLATLRCTEEAFVTHFGAAEFQSLEPERAFQVLYAAAQLTAYTILEREVGR